METITGIENNTQNLTELECKVIEAQAVDRYKRYLKASKEIAKEAQKVDAEARAIAEAKGGALSLEEDDALDGRFMDAFSIICKKHEIPDLFDLFGYPSYLEPTLPYAIEDFQSAKAWMKAAAHGRMSEIQFYFWIMICEEEECIDPYWLMLGVPYYFRDKDRAAELGFFDGMEETLLALCTRNSIKAKRLPLIGCRLWSQMYGHCSHGIYPIEYQVIAHNAKEAIELYEEDIRAGEDQEECKSKIREIKKDIKDIASKNPKAKAYFKLHKVI